MTDILKLATERSVTVDLEPETEYLPELSLADGTCLYCGIPAASGRCPKHAVYTAKQVGQEVMRRMRQDAAETYALHRKATRIAADKGDARPAEWALERAIPDLQKKPDAGPVGIQVVVGINLPGLPGYGD